jgi:ATP adenylyltransferase
VERLWAAWRLSYVTNDDRTDRECPFCGLEQEDPAEDQRRHVLYRGHYSAALLNRYPYSNGHVLVVPYNHCEALDDLPTGVVQDLHETLMIAVKALRISYQPDGLNIGMNMGSAAGAGIAAHLHYHVVPRWAGDTNFMPVVSQTKVLPETLDMTWKKLKSSFESLQT